MSFNKGEGGGGGRLQVQNGVHLVIIKWGLCSYVKPFLLGLFRADEFQQGQKSL